jgi:hypothetical protein
LNCREWAAARCPALFWTTDTMFTHVLSTLHIHHTPQPSAREFPADEIF